MSLNVEKIIEKKKKMVMGAKSTVLPLIQTTKNSPGTEIQNDPVNGRNFSLGIDHNHSHRIEENAYESKTINVTSKNAPSSSNRYANNKNDLQKAA